MTKNQQIVLNAIRSVIDKRIETRHFPYCALAREVREEFKGEDITSDEYIFAIMDLVQAGTIKRRMTYHEESYYLNNNDHECNS